MMTNLRRKLLYIAFILLSGVAPAYSRERRKKFDKTQLSKEASRPWEGLEFEVIDDLATKK